MFVSIWPLIKPMGQVESARVIHQPDVFLSDALEVLSKDVDGLLGSKLLLVSVSAFACGSCEMHWEGYNCTS